jgi:hypothetical protein
MLRHAGYVAHIDDAPQCKDEVFKRDGAFRSKPARFKRHRLCVEINVGNASLQHVGATAKEPERVDYVLRR